MILGEDADDGSGVDLRVEFGRRTTMSRNFVQQGAVVFLEDAPLVPRQSMIFGRVRAQGWVLSVLHCTLALYIHTPDAVRSFAGVHSSSPSPGGSRSSLSVFEIKMKLKSRREPNKRRQSLVLLIEDSEYYD